MKTRCIAIVCALIAICAGQLADLAQGEGESCSARETVYPLVKYAILDEPSADGQRVRHAAVGERLDIISSTRSGAWCWLEVRNGWLIDSARALSSQPPESAAAAEIGAGSSCYRADKAYLVGNMNVRAEPTTDAPVAARARAGDAFGVTDSRRGKRWCWLKVEGGWMAKTSRVRSTEPAQPVLPATSGQVPSQPADVNNCCFVDRQCTSERDWVDGYWAYQNGQCGGQAQTSTQASAGGSQVNNCCFIGWQCHTDDDWLRGFSAYQSNQCQNAEMQAALSVVIPPGVDNCCRINRDCQSDADWNSGWLAFQHFRCKLPSPSDGISIQGSPEFVAQVTNALRLLRDRAPKWWKYSTSGLNAMKMIPEGGISGVYPHTKVYEETLSEVLKDGRGEAGLVYVIFGIVHEACHIHEDHRYADGADEEKACMEASLYALQEINPADRSTIEWIKWIIANIHDPDVQWW